MLARTLLACLPIVIPTVAAAQSGGTAHLYAYRIKDRAAFEAGYRQHLRWHARHADKLAWFAWYVTSGDRAGSFVDGTFGTTPDGLAGRPDPEGDGADFRTNAGPYVSASGDEGWELWREASQATPLEQRRPGTYLHVYAIAADNKAAFEAAIATRPLHGATWYRGLDGASDHYLLMLPARLPGAPPPVSLGSQVRTLRAETWQYAPRLALMPGAPLVR
ncbi:MAG: hypothetical protein JF608_03820 [Sphingomonadales bacterium]|nr:hypothetical protein [Sphingomonadales bacterium]